MGLINPKRSAYHNAITIFGSRSVYEVNNEFANIAFHDLTPPDYYIPGIVKRLLGLNLNFCPTPRQIKPIAYAEAFEQYRRSIRLQWQFRNSQDRGYIRKLYVPNPNFQPDKAATRIETALANMHSRLEPDLRNAIPRNIRHNLSLKQRLTLKQLRHHPTLKVVKCDKNLGPAILTREQYLRLCLQHLQGTSKSYERLDEQPNITELQEKVRNMYSLICSKYPDEQKYAKIITHNLAQTGLAKFHGMPKIHKRNDNDEWTEAMRPIVSSVNSVNHGLSKWIEYHLCPLAQETCSFVRDSDSVLQDLAEFKPQDGDVLVTMDAVSLYTSIPCGKAMEAIKRMMERFPQRYPLSMRGFILQAASIILHSNYFKFGDTYWKQTRGIAMGTPAAPTIANIFLAFHEIQIKQDHHDLMENVRLFRRFIDDLVMIWNPKNAKYTIAEVKELLEEKQDIKWTLDQMGDRVAFLDLNIQLEATRITTTTFQKKLNLYLYTAARSAHPKGVLEGLITGLVTKYARQNTYFRDFKDLCQLFARRLHARGFRANYLKKRFSELLRHWKAADWNQTASPREQNVTAKLALFKVAYDPNGPSRYDLRRLLNFAEVEEQCKLLGLNVRSIICYTKPANLGNLITRTDVDDNKSPTAAELAIGNTNENNNQ